jgi:hypothetical protein
VISARIRIGEPHRMQVKECTSYSWAISLPQVERLSLSETQQAASAKGGGTTVFGSGGLGGVTLRSVRCGWDLNLGVSYRMDPIQSIPGVVIYRPPVLYASLIKNLLSKSRQR